MVSVVRVATYCLEHILMHKIKIAVVVDINRRQYDDVIAMTSRQTNGGYRFWLWIAQNRKSNATCVVGWWKFEPT